MTPHAWTARADDVDKPDRLVFDLDPPDEDAGAHFGVIREGALALGDLLRELGLEPFAMTSGSRGLHVVAPLRRRARLRHGRARGPASSPSCSSSAIPHGLTTAWRKEKRGGRVLVDVARNTYGQTTVAPYAVRALPGAPVATPLAWEELDDDDLHPRRWTLATVPEPPRGARRSLGRDRQGAAPLPRSRRPVSAARELVQARALVRVERLALGTGARACRRSRRRSRPSSSGSAIRRQVASTPCSSGESGLIPASVTIFVGM